MLLLSGSPMQSQRPTAMNKPKKPKPKSYWAKSNSFFFPKSPDNKAEPSFRDNDATRLRKSGRLR